MPKTALIGTAHRAEIKGTKHYFKRSGDSFYAMEHYELMDVMARVKHPDVTASVDLMKTSFTTPGRWDFNLQVTLANRGAIPAVDIYLELYVPYILREGITKFPQIRSEKLDGKDYRVYAYHHRDATGPLPLFPGVEYPIMDGNNRYVNLKMESALPLNDLKNEYISWTVYADRSEAKRYRVSAADLCRVI